MVVPLVLVQSAETGGATTSPAAITTGAITKYASRISASLRTVTRNLCRETVQINRKPAAPTEKGSSDSPDEANKVVPSSVRLWMSVLTLLAQRGFENLLPPLRSNRHGSPSSMARHQRS